MRIIASILFLLSAPSAIEAQTQVPAQSQVPTQTEVPARVQSQSPTTAQRWIDPGWRRTVARYTVTFDSQGLGTSVYEFEFRVLESKGISSIAQMSFDYDDYFQSVSISNLATLKADGTVIEVDPGAIRDQLAPTDTSSPYFDHRRVKLVAFPSVAVGDRVRGRIAYGAKKAVLPGEFANYWSQSQDQPPETMELTLDGPADRPLQIATRGVTHSQESAGNRIVHHVVFKHETPVPLSTQTDRFDSNHRFEASTFKDYAAFAATLKARNAPMAVPDEAMAKLSAQIAGDATTPRLKAERIYNWVAQNIRYVGIGLENGGMTSQPARSVLAARYGDCKAHVAILKALLAAQGIEADFVIVNSSPQYTLTHVATANFDHAIAYIPLLDLFVDPTSSLTPFGALSPALYGKPVLNIDRGTLSAIPRMRPEDFVLEAATHYTLLPDGTRKARSILSGSGSGAALTRALALSLESVDSQKFAERMIVDYAKLTGTGDYSFTDPRDLSGRFEISAPFTISKALDIRSREKFRLLPLTDPRSLWPATGVDFSETAFRCSPVTFSDVATLDFPAGSHVYKRPNKEIYAEKFQAETPYGPVSGSAEISRYVVLNGDSLRSETRGVITFSAPICPAAFAAHIKAAIDRFDQFERDPIGLTTSPVPRIQDSGSDLADALAAYQSGDYTRAKIGFRRLVGKGNADAQIQLASMYAEGKGVEKNMALAIALYEEAAAQHDVDAQNNLGWIYASGKGVAQDYAAARTWYQRSADAGNEYAQYSLGALYAEGRGVPIDYAAAARLFQQAAATGSAKAQYSLGWMYENGIYFAQSNVAAIEWYRKSAMSGQLEAQARLDDLCAPKRSFLGKLISLLTTMR